MSARRPLVWGLGRVGLIAFVALTLAYLILPSLIILPLSFSSESFLSFPPPGYSLKWYQQLFATGAYGTAILNSLIIGLPSAALATAAGIMAAISITRGSYRFRGLLGAMILAPMILPQIVLALGLYPIMAKLGIVGSYPAVVIAHAVVTMPLVFITVSAALKAYAPQMELAAATLGASPWNCFRHITLPLIRPGVVIGFIFAFTFSFDELILALFLTSPTTRTMPRLLWEQLNYQMTPVIAAVTVLILVGTLSLIALGALLGRRKGRKPERSAAQ